MSVSNKVRYGNLYIKSSDEYILHRFYTDSVALKDGTSLTNKLTSLDDNINTIEEGFVFINNNGTAILNTSKATTASFSDNQLKVSSTYFTLALDGTVNISAGAIGGWTIGKKSLYYNTDSIGSTTVGTYLGTDGIYQYANDKTYLYIVSGNIEQMYGSSNMVYLERGKITIEDTSTGILTEYTNNGISLYENEQLIGDIGIYKIDGITSLRLQANDSNEIVFYWNTTPVYYMDYSSNHNGHTSTHSFIGGINAETSVQAESYLKSGTYASIGSYLTTGTYANIGTTLTTGSNATIGGHIEISTYGVAGTSSYTGTPYFRTISTYGSVQLEVSTSSNLGVYSNTQSHWLIYESSDPYIYVGNVANNTYVRGNVVRLLGANVTNSSSGSGASIRLARSNNSTSDASESNGVYLQCGADSSDYYICSHTTYSRTVSSSANVHIGSAGKLGRSTSSSAQYKNSIIALTNPQNTTQINIKKSDCINGSDSTLVDSDDLKDGFIDSDNNDNSSNELENSSEYEEYTKDALSLLEVPVSLFKYNEGYVSGEYDFDYDKYILGFIAEDVEGVCPNCVEYQTKTIYKTDDDGNYVLDEDGMKIDLYEQKTDIVENWSVHDMIPRIVFILQYQQKLIEDQAEEIEKLKANFN